MTDIQLKTEPPSFNQATQRYENLVSEHYDPPLTDKEKQMVRRACLDGLPIFLRCSFSTSLSDKEERK